MAFFRKTNVKIVISQHFEIFTFFIFQILVSVSQRIFNSWGWIWSQIFTYGPYYPPLAITPFRSNETFTYEMLHIIGLENKSLNVVTVNKVGRVSPFYSRCVGSVPLCTFKFFSSIFLVNFFFNFFIFFILKKFKLIFNLIFTNV